VQEFNKGVYDYIIATDENGKWEQDDDVEEPQADDIEEPQADGEEFEECS